MIRGPDRSWIIPAALALLLAGSLTSALSGPRESIPLNVGFGRTSFLNVNLADAKVAFKMLTKQVGEKNGYDLDIVVHTYDSDQELHDAIKSGALQIVIMPVWDYITTDLDQYLEPGFFSIESGYGAREYLLLARESAEYKYLSDLRGKRLLMLENANCEMSRMWVRTMLLEEGMDLDDPGFGGLEPVTKPTQALLPVFFGTADACIVSRPIFETMSELNPQLERRLRSVIVSEPLIDSVTFIAYDGWAEARHRSDLFASLEGLHRDPEGKQILTLFKADRLKPYDDRYMDGTRALRAKHDQLLEEMGSK